MTIDIHREVKLAVARAKIQRTCNQGRPYFVCPDCCRYTPHPDDVANSYCPWCHAYKYTADMAPRCFEPFCPDFGDPDFGKPPAPSSTPSRLP